MKSFYPRFQVFPGFRAYTLVELLMSVAILTLVLSVLFYVFSSGSKQGKKLYLSQSAHQVAGRCMQVLRKDLRSTFKMSHSTQELHLGITTLDLKGDPMDDSVTWKWDPRKIERMDAKGKKVFSFASELRQDESLRVDFKWTQSQTFSSLIGIEKPKGQIQILSQETIYLESLAP